MRKHVREGKVVEKFDCAGYYLYERADPSTAHPDGAADGG